MSVNNPNHQPQNWVRADLKTTGSTNHDALVLAAQNPGKVVLVRADTQFAGRGQAGRAWASPAGGAWFSIAVPIAQVAFENMAAAPLVAGLAVAVTLNEKLFSAGVGPAAGPVKIKWPNDLLLNGRKTAGLLCELAAPDPAREERVLIAGVGINVNLVDADFPCDLRFPATSLRLYSGRVWPINQIVIDCAIEMLSAIDGLENDGLSPALKNEIQNHMAWLDEEIELISPGAYAAGRDNPAAGTTTIGDAGRAQSPGRLYGRLQGIDDRGRLQAMIDGKTRAFDVGEVRLARNANP